MSAPVSAAGSAERLAPVFASLTTPTLRAGMEGQALLVIALLDLVLFILAHPATLVAGAILTAIALVAGRAAAKSDPQMIEVYFRHLRRDFASDGGYVPAQGEPGAPEALVVKAVGELR